MAGFMRQHPDNLVRGLRLHDGAVIYENAAAIRDKGVKRTIVDDDNLDVLLFEARRAQNRPGVFAQQLLGLGIADDRRALFLFRAGNRDRRQGERGRGGDGDQAGCFLAVRGAEQHDSF